FDLTQREAIEIGSSRKAAWEVILGDAHHELSDYESSASHYQRAMELLGYRLAVSKTERIGALFRNAATQLRLRFASRNSCPWLTRTGPTCSASLICRNFYRSSTSTRMTRWPFSTE